MGTWRSELSEGIRKRGFRKWYERELIAGHAHLVLTILCALGLLGGFEVYDRHAVWTEQIATVLAVLFLGERLQTAHCVGAAFIATGLWLIYRTGANRPAT